MTIDDAIEFFEMNLYNKNLSQKTIDSYLKEMTFFENFLKDEGIYNMADIKSIYLEKFNASLVKKGNKPTTRSRKLSVLTSFFNYCYKQGLIDNDPSQSLPNVKVTDADQKRKEVLTVKETHKLIESVTKQSRNKIKNRAILELFLFCGLRVNELTQLKWDDVDRDRNIIRIEGKGGKERNIPLFKEIDSDLKDLKKMQKTKSDYIFTAKNTSLPMSERSAHDLIKRHIQKAGINKNIGCHSLRSTAATNYLREGISVRYIQMLLGHSDISTTTRYMNPDEDEVNQKLKEAHSTIQKRKK